MFKTIKSRVIFVSVLCSIFIIITIIAIIYKNIEVNNEIAQENSKIEKQENDTTGIDLKGTYNQNNLTINEKKVTKDKVEIKYCQINGLNDNVIQNNINKELETIALNCYKEEIKNLDEVINVSVNMNNLANFSNVLSFEVSYVAKKDDDGEGFYQGLKGLNYDLTTGNKITIDKMFTKEAPVEDILRKSAYYSLIQRNVEDNLSGNLVVSDYGNVEDEIELFISNYKKGKLTEFEFSPSKINVFLENNDIVTIDMSSCSSYIAIYSRYLESGTDIYEKDDVGLKNLYTLSTREKSQYSYMNYQKGSNYFIDVNLIDYDTSDNSFSESLKKQKIAEIEKQIEKIKNLVSKNPNNFYILNCNISIATTYDNTLMKNMTFCITKGNSYEMSMNDFSQNVEPIIIKINRQTNESELPKYIYNFSSVLNTEIQTIREEYNPETGEKVVI